jgi:hypothetical protein
VEQNYDTVDGWRGEAVVGVKRGWTNEHGGALALQAGAFWDSHPADGCSEGGAEARVLVGRRLGDHGFVNAEAAERRLRGGCSGERLDLTLGYHAGERWLGLAQLFVDAPSRGDDSVKAQLTLVRFGDSGRAIQFGVRARLDGDDAEPALVLGLWGRPGED